MKKILLSTAVVLCAVTLNAKTWRINYDQSANADFRTLKEACDNVNVHDGDVFYMEPGYHYGTEEQNTITRRCTVMGPGWGFKNNAGEEIEVSTTYFTNAIRVAHDSVRVVGLNMNLTTYGYNIIIEGGSYTSPRKKVTIERCRVSSIRYDDGYNTYYSYITIQNNYVLEDIYFGYPTTTYRGHLDYSSIIGNIVFGKITCGHEASVGTRVDHNTIIRYNYSSEYLLYANQGDVVTNNIIINGYSGQETDFVVNVFADGYTNNYNVYSITPEQYNTETATGSTKYSAHPTNKYIGATVENTFVNTVEGDFYDEAMRYRVKDGNAAKTAASDGGECGAFGGDHPYVLCGRPTGVPYLYDVDVPEQPTNNTLSISFKVAGQNE